MTNAHVLQHHPAENPGAIGDWIAARGGTIRTTHLHRGEPLPADPAGIDLLVVMGGPMNIYQDRDHPWLKAERAFIAAHLAAGGRAIGICLGAQFLADALGGRVLQNPHVEIGWWPVAFTPEARARFAGLPPSLDVLHWHGDTFSLPPGAVRLAHNAACDNQAFLFEDRVLGLQFHPEVNPVTVDALVTAFGDELVPSPHVQPAAPIRERAAESCEVANRHLVTLLNALFA